MAKQDRERALAFFLEHEEDLARAIVDENEALSPEFGAIDKSARRRSAVQLIRIIVEAVRSGDNDRVVSFMGDLIELRTPSGASLAAMVASPHCYMPVACRLLVAGSADPLEGLRLFEAVEGRLLRLVTAVTVAMVSRA